METTQSKEIAEAVIVEEADPNIVEVAVGNENFSTLVAAVKAADLVETLSGKGPFTVFAPTNDAFNKLPEGTVGTLLKPENKGKLTSILTYHVVSGKYEASAVIDAIKKNNGSFTVATVQGGEITLSLSDGNVMLKDANGGMSTVIMADVAASNGVIHAIDSVVMPK
ncbi:fasciclin domain-containing protein [Winogradskyella schleiferi]|uniref:fasciclin domain-containing protein n=1 Tax=Winogradskyella schleiferi TaxID=2686078 RepID=UPI003743283E